MKVAIIGTTSYKSKMLSYKSGLERQGMEVRMPAFDDHPELKTELDILTYNVEMIKWADEIHLFWDCRSMGTIFDFGAAFALGKKVVPVYLEKKTFMNAMHQYYQKGEWQNQHLSALELGLGPK